MGWFLGVEGLQSKKVMQSIQTPLVGMLVWCEGMFVDVSMYVCECVCGGGVGLPPPRAGPEQAHRPRNVGDVGGGLMRRAQQ